MLLSLANELYFGATFEERRALVDEALAMARRLGDDRLLLDALLVAHIALVHARTAEQRLASSPRRWSWPRHRRRAGLRGRGDPARGRRGRARAGRPDVGVGGPRATRGRAARHQYGLLILEAWRCPGWRWPAASRSATSGRPDAAPDGAHREPRFVFEQLKGLARTITGKEKPDFAGPVGITKEMAKAVQSGPGPAFLLLAMLSAYLGWFNLLPVPALDGGRLIFLFFEAIARRKPDAKVEAHVHMVGLVMMLGLIGIVTYFDIFPKH